MAALPAAESSFVDILSGENGEVAEDDEEGRRNWVLLAAAGEAAVFGSGLVIPELGFGLQVL